MAKFKSFERVPLVEARSSGSGLRGLARGAASASMRGTLRLSRTILRLCRRLPDLLRPAKQAFLRMAAWRKQTVKAVKPEFDVEKPMWELMQQLHLRQNGQPSRVTAFISSRPEEGSSRIARDYAMTLASKAKRKVLLIDANPLTSRPFQAYGSGLSVETLNAIMGPSLERAEFFSAKEEFFSAKEKAAFYQENDSTNGTGHKSSAKRSNSVGAGTDIVRSAHPHAHSWETLLESFDSLVIDVPPLQNSFNGVVLAAKADAAVLVVAAETTPRAVVRNLCDTLTSANARIAGVVMNRRRFYIPEKIYRWL